MGQYNQIIIKEFIYYYQEYQVNYCKLIHNKEVECQRVISQKQQVEEEIEKIGIIDLTNYAIRINTNNKRENVENIKI